MTRMLLLCVALTVFSLPVRADSTVTPAETLIRLNVQPMPAPKPALRYLLLPELREMTPGNPIPAYLKCVLAHESAEPDSDTLGKFALRQADRAARMDKPDWQILLRAKTDGINLLLPDVQKMRAIAASLQGRFRQEAGRRQFDDAVVTAKTMFALSRHMGEHPTLIGDLVGIAIAVITIGPLEEMLEQPGCPNFYWALTNLPSPFISLDRGMEGERMLILAELRDLDDNAPMSPEQLKKLIAHIDKLRQFEDPAKKKTAKSTREWLDAKTKDKTTIDAARRRLVDVGLSEERLKTFPAEQIMLLDERREYQVRRDEIMKVMNLPIWQANEMARKVKPVEEPSLFFFLVPAMQKVRIAQGRLEQRIGLLRGVEALRMYAADHGGKWPDSLADVDVPVPVDPFTGKPFLYKRDGVTAHLRGSPPPGMENVPVYNLHYELTVQK